MVAQWQRQKDDLSPACATALQAMPTATPLHSDVQSMQQIPAVCIQNDDDDPGNQQWLRCNPTLSCQLGRNAV